MKPRSDITGSEAAVQALPRRVAHAVYALVALGRDEPYGPFTASEVVLYDEEARDARATGRALQSAAKLGWVLCIERRYWTPTCRALDRRKALEERFLLDVGADFLDVGADE